MTYKLSQKSLDRLTNVHPHLRAVVLEAIKISHVDFSVLEGVRNVEKQRQLFNAGATKTLNSRHLTGHAVDLAAYVNGEIRWDWPLYHEIATAMKISAQKLAVPIEWGGDWKSFPDGPHFQLPWSVYP
jgi:peptidoglycan LD-endopeptidase CwlK